MQKPTQLQPVHPQEQIPHCTLPACREPPQGSPGNPQ